MAKELRVLAERGDLLVIVIYRVGFNGLRRTGKGVSNGKDSVVVVVVVN